MKKHPKPLDPENDRLLPQSEVVELLDTTRETLWRWRREGVFPEGVRMNNRGDLAWPESVVRSWLAKRAQGLLFSFSGSMPQGAAQGAR